MCFSDTKVISKFKSFTLMAQILEIPFSRDIYNLFRFGVIITQLLFTVDDSFINMKNKEPYFRFSIFKFKYNLSCDLLLLVCNAQLLLPLTNLMNSSSL